MKSIIGFSSGFNYQNLSPFSEKAIMLCREASPDVIEINCVGGLIETGRDVRNIKKECLSDFGLVSLHAPCHNIIYGQDSYTILILKAIEALCRKHDIHLVVFHPDLIADYKIFLFFDIPVAIENMDVRKSIGISVEGMKKIFDQGSWKFVLDLNHCFSIDPSMELAREFIKEFGDRLAEIHLSGYIKYHELIYVTKQREILEAIPELNIPIILEGVCTREHHDRKREVNYVREYLLDR